jgi:hypothetical protein
MYPRDIWAYLRFIVIQHAVNHGACSTNIEGLLSDISFLRHTGPYRYPTMMMFSSCNHVLHGRKTVLRVFKSRSCGVISPLLLPHNQHGLSIQETSYYSGSRDFQLKKR